MTNGNDARLLAHHDDHRVRFVAQSDRRAMTHAERAIEISALGRREGAPCVLDPVSANDDTAIVQRRLREEKRDDQRG